MKKHKNLFLMLAVIAILSVSNISLAKAAIIPPVPNITSVTPIGSAKLNIHWKYQGKYYDDYENTYRFFGYQIWRSTSKTGKYTRVKTFNGSEYESAYTSYTNTKLKNGVTYYYKIRSFIKDSKGNRIYSNFSSVKSGCPRAKTEGKYKIGTYKYNYNAPLSGYFVTIEKFSKNSASFQISQYGRNASPIYTSNVITAKVKNNICRFNWKDTWGNKGKGTLKFGNRMVNITMKQTYTASGNRASLATTNRTLKWHDSSTSLDRWDLS